MKKTLNQYGQFESAQGGQFKSASGGQLKSARGGQFDRRLHQRSMQMRLSDTHIDKYLILVIGLQPFF